ncbi:hypothetical protein GCM10007978_41300 [Shewanella hanedai]|jgi:hypothetical protein|uniref:Uncharacterized protein n=1 Tax=Shewanella hanedai TaxID=25 RepID=A0A553JIL6_SHEHA|nr:TapY2 family type IVa secretion system protein [Shewanella hanedai]TRY12296.1 hypothetical protein FN961_21415 [Shewanella hanedai]GGI99204.1 hypothetical protein GCM10007978_41300 [Shewanella hanedai]
MKSYIVSLFLFALSMSTFASEKQDYKCFINSTDGDRVVFYRWEAKEIKLKMATLVGRTNMNKKGKKYYIKNVQECVLINQDFESSDGQDIDKITLH